MWVQQLHTQPPSHHHKYIGGMFTIHYHSQSWVVYGIVSHTFSRLLVHMITLKCNYVPISNHTHNIGKTPQEMVYELINHRNLGISCGLKHPKIQCPAEILTSCSCARAFCTSQKCHGHTAQSHRDGDLIQRNM